ncbi:MAG: methyltransferase domain-containing protein [Propionibacteriaceae bacterium]|nr:methyltransferase domain-containing protein [Propionibacteriaceae bacterium]
MTLTAATGLLTCPHCHALLTLTEKTACCPSGHSFDVARQGYLNLLPRSAGANADTAAMVAARERFLATGAYRMIADAVAEAAGGLPASVTPARSSPPRVIVETGCGTGYYLAHVLEVFPDAVGVGVDVSVAAVKRAARAHPRMATVVADVWDRIPMPDGCADAVLCVFAPRDPAEFARVLRPGGRLVVAIPAPGHLAALRRDHGLLAIEAGKENHVLEQMAGAFTLDHRVDLHGEATVTAAQASDLIAMGPNGFHAPAPVDAPERIAIDVTVLTFQRRFSSV